MRRESLAQLATLLNAAGFGMVMTMLFFIARGSDTLLYLQLCAYVAYGGLALIALANVLRQRAQATPPELTPRGSECPPPRLP